MKLSNNFSLSELTKSQTATRKGIDNEPGTAEIENLIHLAESVLQPVREHFGKPVMISSGYRSPELCEAIGSSSKSQHAKGEAADFEIHGVDNKELATWISNNTTFDQLILEFYDEGDPNSGWVHCSAVTGEPRKQGLRASKVEGRTKYEQILLQIQSLISSPIISLAMSILSLSDLTIRSSIVFSAIRSTQVTLPVWPIR